MEQDYIAGLYQSLGMSVGAEFTPEDVSLLYSKVFHFPSNITEAHGAMRKIAGGHSNWTCIGENVLDVLLEMEREREKKELLYWDLLLLNTENPNAFHHTMDSLLQNMDFNTFKKAYSSDLGPLQQIGRWGGGKELSGKKTCVKRLKKAARQCWASKRLLDLQPHHPDHCAACVKSQRIKNLKGVTLASQGVWSILPSTWQSQSRRIRGQAWGHVSLSDILLLVDVKYDVVTRLLYTEMLQEHHTKSVWETMLPWQQHQEVEQLEDHVDEALASVDMLSLAELPGAFRMYKACMSASFRSCSEQSWSAISFLNELHKFRLQEHDALIVLGERLHGECLRLLCLYIRLATIRAQREKMSYTALLAAHQSWETWPHVNGPCRAEQASMWLHGKAEEKEYDFETIEQQSMLQLLVLTQEQERKQLVTLIQGISIKDLQAPACTVPPKYDNDHHVPLRNGCIKRLHQIHAWLQTHSGTQSLLQQTNPEPQPKTQHKVQAYREWSQLLLEDCTLLLLTHLTELQEVQASVLLQAMMDENAQLLQALWDKYKSEFQAQCFSNLLHLLISDVPLSSGSMLNRYPNCTENSSSNQIIVQSSYTGQAEVQNMSGGSAETETVNSNKSHNSVMNELQNADGTYKQDVCSGCGAVMEDLPYLEILCVSDAHEGLAAEGGAKEEQEGSELKSPQSCEKQGSLITLAWSKPPEDDTDNAAEPADGCTGQIQDGVRSLKVQAQPTQCNVSDRESDGEELKPIVLQPGTPDHCDTQSANQQCSTVEELACSSRQTADQPNEEEAVFERGLQTHALVAESKAATQPHPMADSSECNPHADNLWYGTCNDITNDRDVTDVETESKQWHMTDPEPAHYEEQNYCPEVTIDCSLSECKAKKEPSLTERERVSEPVSAMERERTMRNLVDMQRKVEQRQQRDRERQLLRVQERLSIIQNRKAEEDLLGLKHTDRIKHLTQDLPLKDKNQQKTVVKERLEQLRRERSYVMQSKRDRNTTGFKELLGPVALQSRDMEDAED